ncbi:MAG: hypothetical protein ACYSWO_02020 [Planctomycetota bacterium]|jgi:hypothetical protein
MHTIDLQRGQGIPARITAASLGIIMVVVLVPFAAAAVMLGGYLQNKKTIAMQRQETARFQASIEKLAEAVAFKETIEKKADTIMPKLSEVSSCVSDFLQWSPILETLAKNMPAEMVMTRLTAKSTPGKKQVPKRYEPDKTIEVPFSRRTLVLDISGDLPGNYEQMVRVYRNQLKSSPTLGPKLKDITTSKKPISAGDDKTVTWTMNLVFEFES